MEFSNNHFHNLFASRCKALVKEFSEQLGAPKQLPHREQKDGPLRVKDGIK